MNILCLSSLRFLLTSPDSFYLIECWPGSFVIKQLTYNWQRMNMVPNVYKHPPHISFQSSEKGICFSFFHPMLLFFHASSLPCPKPSWLVFMVSWDLFSSEPPFAGRWKMVVKIRRPKRHPPLPNGRNLPTSQRLVWNLEPSLWVFYQCKVGSNLEYKKIQ